MLVCEAKTAQELMSGLYDIDHRGWSGDWYFRGQGDSSWRLSPTLFRDSITEDGSGTPSLKDGGRTLRAFEEALIDKMARVLEHKTTLPERLLSDRAYLLAFARHYGVKTRMLDWSRSPMVGAYFAAAGAIARRPFHGNFSVFAMARIYDISAGMVESKILSPPDGGNQNLAAQHGVLVLQAWNQPDLWHSERAVPSTLDAAAKKSADVESRLIRVDVPVTEAVSLLHHLRKRGVDGSSVYPGNHGLASLAEELAWQDLDPDGHLKLLQDKGPLLYVDPNQAPGRSAAPPTDEVD